LYIRLRQRDEELGSDWSSERSGILSSPQGEKRPLLTPFQAFKKIADTLADPVVSQVNSFDLLNQLSTEHRCFSSNAPAIRGFRILTSFVKWHQQKVEPIAGLNQPVVLTPVRIYFSAEQRVDPITDLSRMRKVKGDFEVWHLRRHLLSPRSITGSLR
jgi:hypothetical protein